ncbi:DUF2157 domain-containing protein [Stappia sp. ES.058]|uniref:DUF2157 domain-containing protein n=1 Tax=Stappia sp. ES.058 TaxID=1881061 RepID=UPI00087C68A1|nr:DUF2157 domain-containing protein [Stappia sp. ES.058]SDT95607.1 Predicted membrane protein [Stappia sp. ES.058]
MLKSLYRRQLESDLPRWIEAGWIAPEGAAEIRKELGADGAGRFRLPLLLAGIGAICIALALVAFVAANWEAIPRPAKLGGIAVLLLASHAVAAGFAARGWRSVADITTLFAVLVFVAGLSLVGQMYHLPVDWQAGSLIVVVGALAAAWVCASKASALVATVAAVVWLFWRDDPLQLASIDGVLALVLLTATGAHVLRHTSLAGRLAALAQALATYAGFVIGEMDRMDMSRDAEVVSAVLLGLAALSGAFAIWGLLADRFLRGRADGVAELAGTALRTAPVLLALGCVIGLFLGLDSYDFLGNRVDARVFLLWPVNVVGLLAAAGIALAARRGAWDAAFSAVLVASALSFALPLMVVWFPGQVTWIAVIALAGAVAISVAGSAAHRTSWSVLGNLAIAAVMLMLLEHTVGSLIGQSVFFLLAGLALIAVALVSGYVLRKRTGETEAGS